MRRDTILVAAGLVLAASGVFGGCSDGEERGAGAGGSGDGGLCPSASFVKPTSGAKLTEADDADGDACKNGFQYDVELSVTGADGEPATLFADGTQVASEVVTGGKASFKAVQLASNGSSTLTAQIGKNTTCKVSASVSVACGGIPTCNLTKPELSPTHPMLNGVPVADGGDRVSAAGADYQVAFEVSTNIEDGQPVTLAVDGAGVGLTVSAAGGKAQFPGVTLMPDGDHTVVASCTAKSGTTGKSAAGQYPVDTLAPELTVVQPKDGQHFQGSATFTVCGTTTSTDAVDLPSSVGPGQNNLCAGIGTSTPTCAAAVTGGADAGTGGGACVSLNCPGGAPFDVNITLTDKAGNPTKKKVTGVTCASTLPSVQIVNPTTGTGPNAADHILAASATQAKKDQDANAGGAQYTVVACSDVATGSAQLFAGLAAGTLTAVGAPVALTPAQASDNCPTGLTSVARFTNATLPESSEDQGGALVKATELRVDVTDVSTAVGSSPLVDVWVDSVIPTISAFTPNPLCGKHYQSASAVVTNVEVVTSSVPVNVTVTNGGNVANYQGTVLLNGRTNVGDVTFNLGSNSFVATTTEPSGNSGAFQSPCAVTVGNPPVVTWVAPTAASKLNASTDGNSTTAGWQGDLKVCTDVGSVSPTPTIQFAANSVNLGSPIAVDGAGCATLAGATIPEGDAVIISATTSSVAGKGVGTASLTFAVDVAAPGAATGLVATVKDRRQTTFHLAWTAPSDGGKAASGYDVRVSGAAITSANFDAATAVAYTGTPASPGATDGIDVADRYIERDYYFAIAALDKGGNRGPIAATGPTKATFNATTLAGSAANEQFGFTVDGSTSINGDALSDLIVGSQNGTSVYVYFGSATGYAAAPSLTITGTTAAFGFAAAVIGDIDSDGLLDLAIGSPFAGNGKVFVFKGRASWPATLQESQADYVIEATDASFAAARLGFSLARLGDFNGDGADDFVVGSHGFNGNTGRVNIVLGVPAATPFPATVTLPGAYGTRALKIDGSGSGGRFGYSVLGAGKVYSGVGNTLIVAATTLSTGRLYAFKGQAGSAGDIPLASADATYDFSPSVWRGGTPLALLGGLGTANTVIGSGAPNWAGVGGRGYVFSGNATAGAFGAGTGSFSNGAATASNDGFGNAVVGGGISGTSVVSSFIGGPEGDVAFSGTAENGAPTKLYIFNGPKAATITSTDVVTSADVVYPLPTGWIGCSFRSGGIKDSNGDGYGDIALGELNVLTPSYNGRVVVLW